MSAAPAHVSWEQLDLVVDRRDVVYRVTRRLLTRPGEDAPALTRAEALGFLLHYWNAAYYRFRPTTPEEIAAALAPILTTHRDALDAYSVRDIASFVDGDEALISRIFEDLETCDLIGRTGAAKTLAFLVPAFFPLWDNRIAVEYVGRLGPTGTNGGRYLLFMRMMRGTVLALRAARPSAPRDLLRLIDLYHWLHFVRELV